MENEPFLSAEQSSKVLGISLSTFYRNFQAGVYPSVKLRGRTMFPKAAIEAHVHLLEPEHTFTFGRATPADIGERNQYHVGRDGPENRISSQRMLEWLQCNNNICMSVYHAGKMRGCVTLMPVDEPVILAICRDELSEQDLPLTAIRKWTEKNLSVYIPPIFILKTGKPDSDAQVAAFLIRKTLRWALSLHFQYAIKNWYAVGTTPEGQALSEAIGLKPFLSLENGERKAYILENVHDGSPMLKHLMSRLKSGERSM